MSKLRISVSIISLTVLGGVWINTAVAAKDMVAVAKPAQAPAHEVNITEYLPTMMFTVQGKPYVIDRIQDENNEIKGGFAKTSRKCPPFCIHPMEAAPGVVTVGEVEVMEFLKNKVEKGTGMLIDARADSWYIKGTIPGSVNIPFTVFTSEEKDPQLQEALKTLGVVRGGYVNWTDTAHKTMDDFGQHVRKFQWDFSRAKEVLLFCNGPWCDQSPRAIKGLVKLGYPVNKMYYYRGGMQDWLLLGLSVHVPPPPVASSSAKAIPVGTPAKPMAAR